MNNDEKINILERALKVAFTAENLTSYEVSADWSKSLMERIRNEYTPDDIAVDILEKKFLFISWAAAGIAAAFLLVSSLMFSSGYDDLSYDIQSLYADSSLDNITAVIAEQ